MQCEVTVDIFRGKRLFKPVDTSSPILVSHALCLCETVAAIPFYNQSVLVTDSFSNDFDRVMIVLVVSTEPHLHRAKAVAQVPPGLVGKNVKIVLPQKRTRI